MLGKFRFEMLSVIKDRKSISYTQSAVIMYGVKSIFKFSCDRQQRFIFVVHAGAHDTRETVLRYTFTINNIHDCRHGLERRYHYQKLQKDETM